MSDQEKMRVTKVHELINEALPLMMRSAALYTWAAGNATGLEFQAIAQKFEEFGRQELDDTRRLIEKLVALKGKPITDIAPFSSVGSSTAGIAKIIKLENEALEALHAVIPETGQEARSEALEHLLEHILMRKQEQVDFLMRVKG